MSGLSILRWRQPERPMKLVWRGPDGTVVPAIVRDGGTTIAAVIGPPGSPGELRPLATGIAESTAPAQSGVIHTAGYAAAGKGAALYVSDSLATSALAAAHPRFCKQSADGRYWRLSVENGLNVLAAGAAADNVADDSPAFLAALAYLKYFAGLRAAIGYGKGGPRLIVPSGNYYLGASTLDIDFTVIVEGDNGGVFSGGGSTLRWADGVTGIRTQSYNTTGATGTAGVNHLGSSGSIFRNLYLKGGFSSTESESHGIHLRDKAIVENLTIDSFAGDGIYANASASSTPYGNINGSGFANVAIVGCRNGYYFDGFDANALNFRNCVANSNRRYGAWHKMGLHTLWLGGNIETNGSVTGWITKCSHSGNRYYVLPGQAAGAATNAPSGTTANNTWWGYYSAGGVLAGFYPAWTNGMPLRDGGAFRADGVGQTGAIVATYIEPDQSPALIEGDYLCFGSNTNGPFRAATFDGNPYAGWMNCTAGGLRTASHFSVGGNLLASGTALLGSQDSAVVQDGQVYIDSTNFYSFLTFRKLGVTAAEIFGFGNQLYLSGVNGGFLRHGGNTIAGFSTAGLTVSYAGAKLGYDTGAGGAVTQATSKSTGVTLNKACGKVTMNGAALAASTSVSFTLTNSAIATEDTVVVSIGSGATANSYVAQVDAVAAGSCRIQVRNISGGSLSEALVLNFAVIKAVAA